MTRNEFLLTLTSELEKNNVVDAADIVEEYTEHFEFKLADGYSEEEIAAKLGKPEELAAQFVVGSTKMKKKKKSGVKEFFTLFGLCFADIFVGIFFICLIAFEIVIAASILAFVLTALGFVAGIEPLNTVPTTVSLLFVGTFAALAVVFVGLLLYYTAFMCQIFRSYARFHHNVIASAKGQAILPSLPVNPQITPKTNRRIRNMTLVALTVFIVLLISTVTVSAILSGSIQFWKVWDLFGRKV